MPLSWPNYLNFYRGTGEKWLIHARSYVVSWRHIAFLLSRCIIFQIYWCFVHLYHCLAFTNSCSCPKHKYWGFENVINESCNTTVIFHYIHTIHTKTDRPSYIFLALALDWDPGYSDGYGRSRYYPSSGHRQYCQHTFVKICGGIWIYDIAFVSKLATLTDLATLNDTADSIAVPCICR